MSISKWKKWKGKVYDLQNNIIYELKDGNGYKNEYDNIYVHLMYEGEYTNGELNWKGNEYVSINSKLIFKGEYKNGKRKEEGIIFTYKGQYKGQFYFWIIK